MTRRAAYLWMALLTLWAYWAIERIDRAHAPLLAAVRAWRGGSECPADWRTRVFDQMSFDQRFACAKQEGHVIHGGRRP